MVKRFKKATPYFWIATAICVLSLLFRWYVIANRWLDVTHRGDDAARIVSAIELLQLSLGGALHKILWSISDLHPPGDYVIKFIPLRIASWIFGDKTDFVQVTLYAYSFLFSACLALGYLLGKYVAGPVAGLAMVIFLVLSKNLFIFSTGSCGEMTALPFVLTSIVFLAKSFHDDPSKFRKNILICAAFLSLGSTIRSELIVLMPGLCLLIWRYHGFVNGVIFAAVAQSFTILKTAMTLALSPTSMTYLSAGNFYDYKKYSLLGFLRSHFFLNEFVGDFSPYWFVLFLVALGLFLREKPWKKASKSWRKFVIFASGLLSSGILLALVICLGRAPDHPQVTYLPTVFLLATQTMLFFHFIKKTKIQNAILLSLGLIAIGKNYIYMQNRIREIPEGLKVAEKWLKMNTNPSDGYFIDLLHYEDWTLTAHLTTDRNLSSVISYPMDRSLLEADKEAAKTLRATFPKDEFGRYKYLYQSLQVPAQLAIKEVNPKWYVLIGTKRLKTWRSVPWIDEENFSVIYPYTEPPARPGDPGDTLVANLKYSKIKLKLKKAFSNDQVEIFQRVDFQTE